MRSQGLRPGLSSPLAPPFLRHWWGIWKKLEISLKTRQIQ